MTKVPNQKSIQIRLLEGDSSLPVQCNELATAGIRHLPPGLPAGTEVEVTYTFHSNGRLAVDAQLPGFGSPAKIELERIRGLPDGRMQQWQSVICRDGGYGDFETAIAELLVSEAMNEVLPAEADSADESDSPATRPRSNRFEPAIDTGAPQAASEQLKQISRPNKQREVELPASLVAPDFEPAEPQNPAPGNPEQQNPAAAVPQAIPRPRPKRARSYAWVSILGHITASVLGLSLGYYLLVWVRPDLNFLELSLPGLHEQAQPADDGLQQTPITPPGVDQ